MTRQRVDAARQLACELPRPLVFTNGVFDLLHAGHVECLEQARALGRSLVVGINSDASARSLGKGPQRPFSREADRVRVVAALACVSAVLLFEERTPLGLIERLRPDVYVKGDDYAVEELPEAALVRRLGGRSVTVARVPDLSTTELAVRMALANIRT